MTELLRVTLLGLFFGTFGTTLGGIFGIIVKKPSDKFLSFILSLAGGLMTAILSFDLIPEALQISDVKSTLIGIIMGIICMVICNIVVEKKFSDESLERINKRNSNSRTSSANINLLKAGIITSIGLAIHNFPEGLAIGSGFGASLKLGYSLAVAICIHDIPEGISMAIPMKNGGMKAGKVLFYVILSGVTTGLGAFVGKIIGGISEEIISICLSFAAGAMLYIVSGELVPESNKLNSGMPSTIGSIIGFVLGLVATCLWIIFVYTF